MISHLRSRALAALAVGLLLVTGCGGPTKAHVRGTVTVDGKPLQDGVIQFFPTGPTGQSAATTIKNGVYELEASIGEMKVTIASSEVVGKQKMYDTPDSPTIDVVKNSIPAKYNTQSELKAKLAAGPNEANFDLKSK